jgi:hypothetical protein
VRVAAEAGNSGVDFLARHAQVDRRAPPSKRRA